MKLWFCEYFREGSGVPVNLSIGIRSKDAAIHRGKVVSRLNGYCGFWVLSKPEGLAERPRRVEYHGCTVSPSGHIQWRQPLCAT